MWNRFPCVRRVRLLVVTVIFVSVFSVVAFPIRTVSAQPSAAAESHQALAPVAAACGDVVINEVLFNEDTPLDDEWVELYVVNTLPVGTVLIVQDNDSGSSDFYATFTLAEEIAANRYIVVHGENAAGSQEPNIGTLNIYEAGDGTYDLTNSNENIGLSVDGTICEEVYWESSAGNNSPVFGAPSTLVFTGSSAIGDGESIARSPNGSGQFVDGTTPGLYNAAEGQSIGRNNVDGTLAITLGWFESRRAGDSVTFSWQTATEMGTAGFNMLAEDGDGRVLLNPALIPSPVIDSLAPVDYSFTANTQTTVFYLQEVSIDGSVVDFGPFGVDTAYGSRTVDSEAPESQSAEPRLFLPLMN